MIRHDLPGEGPNTAWFDRLNPFEQCETRRQACFGQERVENTALTEYNHAPRSLCAGLAPA